mgnify:CR=1 FL=1
MYARSLLSLPSGETRARYDRRRLRDMFPFFSRFLGGSAFFYLAFWLFLT